MRETIGLGPSIPLGGRTAFVPIKSLGKRENEATPVNIFSMSNGLDIQRDDASAKLSTP